MILLFRHHAASYAPLSFLPQEFILILLHERLTQTGEDTRKALRSCGLE